MFVYIVAFYALSYISSVFQAFTGKHKSGILLVQVLSLWLMLLVPSFTEENTLTFYENIFVPNMISCLISIVCLLIAGISAGIFFDSGFKRNSVGQIIFVTIATVFVAAYVIVVILLMPVTIKQCKCLEGYYGENCEGSCFEPQTGIICSGHGTCTVTGCACDDYFQSEFCNSCINRFSYPTNCTSCETGFSLTSECTKCTVGRDPEKDCEVCLSSYLDDINYNDPVDGTCTVCKENFFRPSTDPRIGSYNAFLEYGEECAPCPEAEGKVCRGHGECNHFLKEDDNGDFIYYDKTVLGLAANGVCECMEGFFGPTCIRGLGFDLENTESICQGHGYITTRYERSLEDIFDTFKGIHCECEEGWIPSNTDDACSCRQVDNVCVECAFGYFINATQQCQQCPGGPFTRACNMRNSGGTCNSDGSCSCRVSYSTGGYTGQSCEECANRNFFNPPATDEPICLPCPGAFGGDVIEACGGHGICITQKRLEHWNNTVDSSDSYELYKFRVGQAAKSKSDLQNDIGKCECFEDYGLNFLGICV